MRSTEQSKNLSKQSGVHYKYFSYTASIGTYTATSRIPEVRLRIVKIWQPLTHPDRKIFQNAVTILFV